MPQQEKQYEDALGSIFDFIFEESQKDPKKVKPLKVTGVDGTSEITDAVTSVLENPLLFVNNTTMDAFNEAIDLKLHETNVGKRVTDKIGINAKDLLAIVRDPAGYVDKQFKRIEGIRKMNKATWAGEEMKGLIATSWARKKGLDREAQQALAGVGRMGARTEVDRINTTARTSQLASRYLAPNSKELTLQEFQSRYGNRLSKDQIKAKFKQYQDYRTNYQTAISNNDDGSLMGLLQNTDLYTMLERTDLGEKARRELRNGDKDKAREYIKAGNFLEVTLEQERDEYKRERKFKEYQNQQKQTVRNLSKTIQQLKSSKDPDKDRKIKEAKSQIDSINYDMRMFRYEELAGKLGEWEGMYYSAKDMFVDGNLLPKIITGDFFDANKNRMKILQPSRKAEYVRKLAGKKGELKVGFHAAKVSGNKFQDKYFRQMNSLYYYSPATLVKSLVTGEIFAYRGFVNSEKFKKKIMKEFTDFDYVKFLEGIAAGDDTYINNYIGLISDQVVKDKLTNMINTFKKKDARLTNLAYRFSAIARFKDKLVKEVRDNKYLKQVLGVPGEIRNIVSQALLKRIKDDAASMAIKAWAKSGGIQMLVSGLVKGALAAIGVTATPVVAALTYLASSLVYRVTKPVTKFGLEAGVLLIIGIFGVYVFSFYAMYTMLFSQHAHVAPVEVVECDEYNVEEFGYQFDYSSGEPVPGSLDFRCGDGQTVQGMYKEIASDMGLGNVPLELIGSSDPRYQAMNPGTWCISSSAGNIYCKADKVNSCRQGVVNLLAHELIHQVQWGSADGALFMEWGADYLTNNGGGYWFRTSSGECIRATNTPRPSACTSDMLETIAYNQAGPREENCYQSLRAYIKDFCVP